jgi:hypothetical protein
VEESASQRSCSGGATSELPPATAVAPTETAAQSPAVTPGPKKRVTIADYKRRREASRTDSTEEEESQQVQPYMSLSAGQLPPFTSLPELPGLEARRTNHQPVRPPKELSPKRGSAAAKKYEKWESKPKEAPPSKGN